MKRSIQTCETFTSVLSLDMISRLEDSSNKKVVGFFIAYREYVCYR